MWKELHFDLNTPLCQMFVLNVLLKEFMAKFVNVEIEIS